MYHFFSHQHKDRFQELCERDKTYFSDLERKTLFYTIAGNDSLYRSVESLYDFEENVIKLEVYEQPFLTGSSRSLIELGYSLYGYGTCDVQDLFKTLDYENSILAIEAIKCRFQIMAYPEARIS